MKETFRGNVSCPACTAAGKCADCQRFATPARPAGGEPREADAMKRRYLAACEMVTALNNGKQDWTMSIPARPEHDPDLVIQAALDDLEILLLRAAASPAGSRGEPPAIRSDELAEAFTVFSRLRKQREPLMECLKAVLEVAHRRAAASPAGGPPGEREREVQAIEALIASGGWANVEPLFNSGYVRGLREALKVLQNPNHYLFDPLAAHPAGGRPEGGSNGK